MSRSVIGLIWALSFVVLEAVQYVYFGNVFQRISSYLFGALVFGVSSTLFIGYALLRSPGQVAAAMAQWPLLLGINVLAALSWVMFLLSVQLIEPAIAYTLGSGAMPLTAWAAVWFGMPEGDRPRNLSEYTGVLVILLSLLVLSGATVLGYSGFVRGGVWVAALGVALALIEGAIFTWFLILCQRIDRRGVGSEALFGLRFVLYVLVAAGAAAAGLDAKAPLGWDQIALLVGIGLILVVPPLYALQRAVVLISALTISTLTALGPFLIFGMQILEGRVSFAALTLLGLGIYFIGAVVAAMGAVRATVRGAADRSAGAGK